MRDLLEAAGVELEAQAQLLDGEQSGRQSGLELCVEVVFSPTIDRTPRWGTPRERCDELTAAAAEAKRDSQAGASRGGNPRGPRDT